MVEQSMESEHRSVEKQLRDGGREKITKKDYGMWVMNKGRQKSK